MGQMSSGQASSATVGESQRQGAFVHYRYELRRGDEILATGYLLRTDPLAVGERIRVAGQPGVVRMIEPELGDRTLRLVVDRTRRRRESGN
ncbi:MAG TPA: hypothetical protein VIR14_01930 [Gaiellaceae bacterium]